MPSTRSKAASANKNSPDAGAAAKPAQKRLPPYERQGLILEGAIKYFAEVGFQGQTRELAKRLGITNALLFRYFPTKEDLIERVYQHVYLGRWHSEWEELLKDRSISLDARLRKFYKSYLSVIFNYEWVRIFFFAGLRGVNINDRYIQILGSRIIEPICSEVRYEFGLPDASEVPISSMESDAVWGLQGQILYISVRRFIYDQRVSDPEQAADAAVDVFLSGISRVAKSATSAAVAAASPAPKADARRR